MNNDTNKDEPSGSTPTQDDGGSSSSDLLADLGYFERYGVRLEKFNDNGTRYWNAVCRYPYGNGEGDTIAEAIEDAKKQRCAERSSGGTGHAGA